MRVLSTGWSGYEIWRTLDIHTRFDALITNGACGVDLFPHYFHNRVAVQIADLTLNVIALALSCYLVRRLVKVGFFFTSRLPVWPSNQKPFFVNPKTYASCMFTRVGAPQHLVRIYRVRYSSSMEYPVMIYETASTALPWRVHLSPDVCLSAGGISVPLDRPAHQRSTCEYIRS